MIVQVFQMILMFKKGLGSPDVARSPWRYWRARDYQTRPESLDRTGRWWHGRTLTWHPVFLPATWRRVPVTLDRGVIRFIKHLRGPLHFVLLGEGSWTTYFCSVLRDQWSASCKASAVSNVLSLSSLKCYLKQVFILFLTTGSNKS